MKVRVLRQFSVFACVFLVGMLSASMAPAQNQNSNVTSAESAATPGKPKDTLTRAKLHTELGALYFQTGNLIVALEELTIATSINPDYAPAYSTRGLVLYYIKELPSAESDFKRALSIAENDPEINNNYGWFLCQTGKEREAIPYFEKAMRNPLYQTPALAYLNAGACYIKLNELDVAEDHIRKSLRLMPDNPQALFQLAKILYQRGNYDAAREYLKKVTQANEPSAEVLWLYLRVERRLGDSSSESSLAAQLRRKYPDSSEYQAFLQGNFE